MAGTMISLSSTADIQLTLTSQNSVTADSHLDTTGTGTTFEQAGGGLVGNANSILTRNITAPAAGATDNSSIKFTTWGNVSASIDSSVSGIFQLTSGSALEVESFLGANTKIQFLGSTPTSELIIDNAANFGVNVGSATYAGPLLEGFCAADVIDLKGIAPTATLNYSATSGDLQVMASSGSAVATLAFQDSSLGTGSFHVASDGSAGTLITRS
jgi:hypothetical protein